jgi:simple sugar transport system permease protein
MSSSPTKIPLIADLVLLPLANLIAAFLMTSVMFALLGESPLECVQILINGAFGNSESIGYTLFYATNFIFTGLAFAVAFHAGLFNIGAEGQAYLGGLGVGLVCLYFSFLPPPLIVLLAILASAAFGAAWAFIPGYLQAYRGSHVVITTIMFNFVAAALMIYIVLQLAPEGTMQAETRTFDVATHLPKMSELFALFGLSIAKTPFNISFIWALICSALLWVLIFRTKLGYELRTLGHSSSVAHYAGMNVRYLIIIAMMISGGLAGFMALNEIMGSQNRLMIEFTSGYGFAGIAVALMGRSHPFGIFLASILFGALYQGGTELAFNKPDITRDMIVFIQGIVILFSGALENMFRPQIAALFTKRPALMGA